MKIVYIISDIDKAVYFEETAIELRNVGFDIRFILINCPKNGLSQFLKSNKFQVNELECGKLINSIGSILAVKKILKTIKPELVHCHLAHANWIGLWGAKLANIKTRIFTRHSGEPLNISWKEKIIDKIQNKLATKIIAISLVIEDLLIQQKVKKSKIKLIHHGFKLDLFQNIDPNELDRIKREYNPNSKTPIIGVVARWMEWKGIHFIIDAFKETLKQHPNAQICLFGGNDKADFSLKLTEIISSLPSDTIIQIPFEKNVYALYSIMDVYVHVPVNNSCEAFGQTYIEALAAKCPSVFTLSGIANEFIVADKHAYVVDYRDSKSISNGINKILSDESYRNQLIDNGYNAVSELFTFSKYISNLKSFYLEKYN